MGKADLWSDPVYGHSCVTQGTAVLSSAIEVLYSHLALKNSNACGGCLRGNLLEQNTNTYILFDQITWIIFLYLSIRNV